MDINLNQVIDQVGKDKGIDRKVLVEALESAMLTAARKKYGEQRELEAHFNEEKGEIEIFEFKTVVEKVEDTFTQLDLDAAHKHDPQATIGDELGFKLDTEDFGRIAAQTAKQVIIQRVREAEREMVFGEYKDRKDELVTGIIRRFERGNIIVDLGRAEAILPVREQCPRESYRAGDRIQAYVIDVQKISRGPQIILSRTTPRLLVKLFEMEVPEIYEGIVRIEAAAREPGSRAKIAVSSSDRDVDPVGACVGMKGSRVQAVVQELRGEKIDIVPWDEDTAKFVCNALSPAEVSRVLVDEGNHTMEIIVPDDQLSLAIGRKGQNVRLAAQLTGWKLDIHSESKIADIKERAWRSLGKVEGVGEMLIQTFYNHGVRSAAELAQTDARLLLQIPGMTEEQAKKIMESAGGVAELERDEESKRQAHEDRLRAARETASELRAILKRTERERLMQVRGMTDGVFDSLTQGNVGTVEALAQAANVDQLGDSTGIGLRKAKQLKYAAGDYLKHENEVRALAEERGVKVSEDDGSVYVEGDEASATPDSMPRAAAAAPAPAPAAAPAQPREVQE